MKSLMKIPFALLAAIPALLLGGCAPAGEVFSTLAPTKTRETFGLFEITQYESKFTRHVGDVRDVKVVQHRYSLLHRGEPVRIDVRTDRADDPGYFEAEFDGLATFAAAQPVLLVTFVHRPTKVRLVYLLRDDGATLHIERVHADLAYYLGDANDGPWGARHQPKGPVAYQRLEPTPPAVAAAVPPPSSMVDFIPGAGRWLLAGFTAAIDTQTYAVLHFPQRPERQYYMRTLMVAPDGNSFVRQVVGNASSTGFDLLVFHLPDLSVDSLPIRLSERMRFAISYGNSAETSRKAWLHHHFEWRPRAGGGYQLVERKQYSPWPVGGGTLDRDSQGRRSYVVRGFRAELGERLAALAETQFKARRLEGSDPRLAQHAAGKPDPAAAYFAVGDEILKLRSEGGRLSLVALRDGPAPALDEIGKAFGARIDDGDHDDLVIP
jgi:hypothetical protein